MHATILTSFEKNITFYYFWVDTGFEKDTNFVMDIILGYKSWSLKSKMKDEAEVVSKIIKNTLHT